MQYYKRHIGDYAKKAGRLSMLQHGAYTLLLDACYDREAFPTLEQAFEWAWASTTQEREAVEFVLSRFFVLVDGIYTQTRIIEVLAEYHAIAETNSRIARERESKRKENSTKRAQDVHEAPPNHKPLTINHNNTKEEHRNNSSIGETEDCQPPANPGRHVSISVLLRNAGMKKANVMNPTIACEFATDERITDEILTLALKVAAEHQKIADISPAYLKPIIEDLLNPPKPKPKAEDWSWMRSDQGIEKKGRELGIRPGATESYASYADRIKSEIIRRKTIAEKEQAA